MSGQQESHVLVLDGGMSRELMRLEAPFRQPEWSALALFEAPHLVRQVHAEFAAAGADIITTNSYALVPFHIGSERFEKQGKDTADSAGRLAREVADQYAEMGVQIRVAGSLPPIFGSYKPELFDEGRVQGFLDVLVSGLTPHIDVWMGETLSLIAEGEAVRKAVASTGKPFWISFTLNDQDGSESPRLRSGETVADAAQWAFQSGAEALLFNCSKPEVMGAALDVARAVFGDKSSSCGKKAPLLGVYANAFTEESSDEDANVGISATRTDLTTKAYVALAREWVARGATIVGGCCGIGHEHVQQLSREFKTEKAAVKE